MKREINQKEQGILFESEPLDRMRKRGVVLAANTARTGNLPGDLAVSQAHFPEAARLKLLGNLGSFCQLRFLVVTPLAKRAHPANPSLAVASGI